MPDRNLTGLIPEFRDKVNQLLTICQSKGYKFVPYETLRSPQRQAALYAQSRTAAQVKAAAANLAGYGAPWLASIMASAQPALGKWATNALPGEGWHEWGEAVDCFLELNGAAFWAAQHPGYIEYARQATILGLTCGRAWAQPDPDHVQLRPAGSALVVMNWEQIDQEMKRRFGG